VGLISCYTAPINVTNIFATVLSSRHPVFQGILPGAILYIDSEKYNLIFIICNLSGYTAQFKQNPALPRKSICPTISIFTRC
jgi:hypothetical protein